MKITDAIFKGIAPKVASQHLQPGQSQLAANCRMESGELRPWYHPSLEETLVTSGSPVQTIFKYLSQYFFEFTADVDLAEGPVAADTENKIYYTGDGIPKKTNESEATTGTAPYPINFYPIAAPTPYIKPTVALGAGGSGDAREMSYVWTIVTSWGEESIMSDASDIIQPKPGQTVDISGLSIEWKASVAYEVGNWVVPTTLADHVYKCVSAGTSGATEPTWGTTVDGDTTDGGATWRCYKKAILFDTGSAKRIYRVNTGDSTASWQMVTDIAMTAETYSDSKVDDDLEDVYLPSQSWDPPDDSLEGLVACSGGFFAAFKGKDIYFSEPYYPHAWPSDYMLSLQHTIVSLATIGNALIVTTVKNPYIIVGTHPGVMSPKRLPDPKGNISKRGTVVTPAGVIYPSKAGFELINGVDARTITVGIFSKQDWAAYYPTTFNSALYNGKYFGFYSSGGNVGALVLDFNNNDVTTLDFYSPAVYVDPSDDTFYYNDYDDPDNKVYEFEGDETQFLADFDYKSRMFRYPRRVRMAYARILFTMGDLADYWALVEARNDVISRNLAKLAEGKIDGAAGRVGGGFWFAEAEITGDELETVPSAPVYAGDLDLTLKVYKGKTLVLTKTIYHDKPFRLGVSGKSTEWEYRLTGNVEAVHQIDIATSIREIRREEQ